MNHAFYTGLVSGLIAIGFKFIHHFTSLKSNLAFTHTTLLELGIIFTSIPIGIYLIKRVSPANEIFTFKAGFKAGMQVVSISAIVLAFSTYIFYKYVDLETMAKIIEQNRVFLKQNSPGHEELKRAIEGVKRFYSPFIQATFILIGAIFGGGIISLLSALGISKFEV